MSGWISLAQNQVVGDVPHQQFLLSESKQIFFVVSQFTRLRDRRTIGQFAHGYTAAA